MKRIFTTLTLLGFIGLLATAQPGIKKVNLHLIPDHANALYSTGEKVKMKVIALDCGLMLERITVNYEVSKDLMPAHLSETISLKGNEATLNVGTLKEPGFLRVKANVIHDGKSYTALSTVGFDTHLLKPSVSMPDDFEAFWQENLKELEKVELHPEMTLMPERCTEKVLTYHISYQNIGNSRMYGILTMPRAEGKYPAILRLPGANVSPKSGDIAHAAQGAIILELGIHGIPVNMEDKVYQDLSSGVLANYWLKDLDSRNRYFYKRVFLGCVQGVDFLLSLPQCNGRIGTLGGSQGGALSIATSALDKRIQASAVYFPALCDVEGYMHNHAGGWPHIFKMKEYCTQPYIENFRYYDAANFARLLQAPVFYAFGYNDITCAPTTTQATYNVIQAPKQISIGANTGHWLFPEQVEKMWNWIIKTLSE